MIDKAYIVKTEEVNIDELNQTLEELQRSNKVLNDSKLYKYIIELKRKLSKYKESNKKYIKKIITASLSILISISISYGTVKSFKKDFNYYDTTKYTYTDGKLTEEKVKSYNSENEAYITEYGYWNKEGTEREIKIYDVSEYTFEDIKDYLNLDLTNIEYDIKTQSSTLEFNNEGQKTITTYIKDENIEYDKLGHIIVSSVFIYLQITEIISFEVAKAIFKESSGKNDYYIQRDDILYIIEDFLIIGEKEIKNSDLISLVDYYNEIKEPLNKILNEIEKNEELRNRFVELFNQNKYLLNEPDILLEKYNEIVKEFDLIKVKKELTTINKSLKRAIK